MTAIDFARCIKFISTGTCKYWPGTKAGKINPPELMASLDIGWNAVKATIGGFPK